MTIQRPALRVCRTLFPALLFFLAPGTAQAESPTLTTLYSFAGGPSDGDDPYAAVVGAGGVLYGTTAGGVAYGRFGGYGTVFSLTPPASPGGAWTEAILHEFTGGTDGSLPDGGVVIGKGGVLYGTAAESGASGVGIVFSLSPPSTPGGSWTFAVLHSFAGGADGAYPQAGLRIGRGGVLYGATNGGGTSGSYGTVFSLTPSASPTGTWTESVLYRFTGPPGDGAIPYASVAIGRDGVLYGTTSVGGPGSTCPAGCGTVYSLTPPASPSGSWTEAVLYSFTGGSDGSNPFAEVAIGNGGVLFGTTYAGGIAPGYSGYGTAFSLTPPISADGPWAETVLYAFTGGSDGAIPQAGLKIGNGGALYGTTDSGGTGSCVYGCGTVYALTPPASPGATWTETVLHSFMGGNQGTSPTASLSIGRHSGFLYGTTARGGTSGAGTVFALTP